MPRYWEVRKQYGSFNQVWDEIAKKYEQYTSMVWEDVCRKSILYLEIDGKKLNPASRWWGGGLNRKAMEIDIIALSTDQTALLIGEVKWSDSNQVTEVVESLQAKVMNIPFAKPEKIIRVLFQKMPTSHPEVVVFTPDDVVNLSA